MTLETIRTLRTRTKTAAAVAVLALVAAGLFFGTNRYGRTLWHQWSQDLSEDVVSLQLEIESIATLVEDADPELEKGRAALAREAVEVEQVERDARERRAALEQAGAEIQSLRQARAQAAGAQVLVAGIAYAPAEVERDLDRRFRAYEAREKEVVARERLLAQKQRAFEAERRRIERATERRAEAEVALEEKRARFRALLALRSAGTARFDDGAVTALEGALERAESRLRACEVQTEMAAPAAGDPRGRGPHGAPRGAPRREVRRPFRGERGPLGWEMARAGGLSEWGLPPRRSCHGLLASHDRTARKGSCGGLARRGEAWPPTVLRSATAGRKPWPSGAPWGLGLRRSSPPPRSYPAGVRSWLARKPWHEGRVRTVRKGGAAGSAGPALLPARTLLVCGHGLRASHGMKDVEGSNRP
jgi:hypothetical protein